MTAMARALAAFAVLAFAKTARADDCIHGRPTDPAGYAGYVYNTPVSSYGTDHVLVWYATGGHHAPRLTTTRADGVPDDVAHAAEVTEDALAKYAAMGFASPISDGTYPSCASNGGDARLDVYLVDFTAADGTTVAESCNVTGGSQCASFILAKAQKGGYASWDEAARTILPHETFHVVQNAYDSEMDRFWAEGTAQWAAKKLDPALVDLERNLPAFFSALDRSLDAPAGGVTAGYLYGAAIWPVFLTTQFGDGIVREILDQEGGLGGAVLAHTDAVLAKHSSSLADAFATFAAWNFATGDRAGSGGYPEAATYPQATLGTLAPNGSVKGISSGLGAFGYRIHADAPQVVRIDTDPARNRAAMIPLVDGKAQLDKVVPLPATVSGDALVVVSATTTKKSDGPFTLTAAMPAGAGADDAGAPSESAPTNSASSGCSVSSAASIPSTNAGIAGRAKGAMWIAMITGVIFVRRRRRA